MPVERRGWVIAFEIGSTGNGRNPIFNGRRQPSCGGTSRMTRECQVRICERLGVKFPGPTRPKCECRLAALMTAIERAADSRRAANRALTRLPDMKRSVESLHGRGDFVARRVESQTWATRQFPNIDRRDGGRDAT